MAGNDNTRPFRFGLQLRPTPDADVAADARRAEEAGFDIVLVPDHVGPGLAPFVTLAAAAAATERIRIGTFVVNADIRNVVQIAWESTSLDHLSGGRFELGLGAGHTPQEFAATGLPFRPSRVRKARLAETVEIIRRLLDGEEVEFDTEHHHLRGAQVDRSRQDRLPILVGGNGAALLGHAGAHAEIVGLQGLGKTQLDGHRHTVRFEPSHLDEQIAQIRAGAGERFGELELNALVQIVDVTDDRAAGLAAACELIDGLEPQDAAAVPYVLIGSVDEIVDDIRRCRDRWGITYFVVRERDAFAPVIAALR